MRTTFEFSTRDTLPQLELQPRAIISLPSTVVGCGVTNKVGRIVETLVIILTEDVFLGLLLNFFNDTKAKEGKLFAKEKHEEKTSPS